MKLEKLDLAALKSCDDVVFHHTNEQTGLIRCIKRVDWKEKEKNPFADEKEHHLIVDSRTARYTLPDYQFRAFYMTGRYQHGQLASIIEILRIGDEISLEWGKDWHTNDYMKHSTGSTEDSSWSTMHSDALHLVIIRGKKRLSFIVGISNCPDNSARMIQPIVYSIRMAS